MSSTMADDERLREALFELELLRKREARQHRETQALLRGLECIRSEQGRAESIRALLKVIGDTITCDHVFIIHTNETQNRITLADSAEFEGLVWKNHGVLTNSSRRIVDIRALLADVEDEVPPPLLRFRSVISEPIRFDSGETAVFVCASDAQGAFGTQDSRLLQRFTNIASQALAGIELEERNAYLAAVISGSSSSVAIGDIKDGKLRISYVNKAFLKLNGYGPTEVLGRDDRVFWHTGKPQPQLDAFRDCILQGDVGTFRLTNRHHRTNQDFCNEIYVEPVASQTGAIRQVVLTQTDITKQLRMEKERDEARTRLEAALSSTGEGFMAMDETGRIIFANAKFAEFVEKYMIDWEVGYEFTDIWTRYLIKNGVPAEIAPEKAQSYLHRLQTQARTIEVRLPDNRTVLVNERPVPGGGAVIVASDITKLKAAEQSLAQRAIAIENVQDGIAITDSKGRVSYANPRFFTQWGFESEDDLLGRKWYAFYDGADVATLEQKWATRPSLHGVRVEMRPKDNTDVLHLVSLNEIEDVGFVVTVHDLTDRLKDERSRAVLREKLQSAQRQQALGQMAAGLAHDFNNLLSAITGSAMLISEDDNATKSNRKAAERISNAGYRAADLVNKLLDLGANETVREETDLRAVLEESLEFAQPSMRPGVQLSANLGESPVISYSNRTDLLQVTLNLMMNALDALPPHGGDITLELERNPALPDSASLHLGRIDTDYTYVKITVRDTGSGIPADKIEQIFQPYFTTKGARGTGLGLAMVSSVIAAKDGGLKVISEVGVGTAFELYWPLTPVPGAVAADPMATDNTVDLKGVTILAVDDEPGASQLIARMLEAHGAEVSSLDDPQLTLEIISEDPGDWGCLITDYHMPGMNGGELVAKTREVAPNLPIVVVTALARRLQDTRINAQTVDAVLAKPVQPGKLAAAVQNAIRNRKEAKETGQT